MFVDERGKENNDTLNKSDFHGADGYTVTINEFMMTIIKLLW